MRWILATWLLLGASCTQAPRPPVPAYAALALSHEPRSVVAAPALVPMTLGCRAEELPLPNAIDDDCDGHIDQATGDDALVVSIAYATNAELAIDLRTKDGTVLSPSVSEPAPPCGSREGTSVVAARFAELPDQEAEIVVRHRGVCGDPENITLAVGIATPEGARSYVGTLAPSEALVLGRLAAP